MNRRKFLRSIGAALAVAPVASVLPVASTCESFSGTSMSRPITGAVLANYNTLTSTTIPYHHSEMLQKEEWAVLDKEIIRAAQYRFKLYNGSS